jgi:hypothetical protein
MRVRATLTAIDRMGCVGRLFRVLMCPVETSYRAQNIQVFAYEKFHGVVAPITGGAYEGGEGGG